MAHANLSRLVHCHQPHPEAARHRRSQPKAGSYLHSGAGI
jgi:hypothetical protein